MEIHMRGEGLTPKQLEVLRRLAEGQPDREIAAAMYVSETTTKRHVRDILSRLDARNRANATHIAHTKGILP